MDSLSGGVVGRMTPTVPPPSDPSYDIEFFWDPVCPFAWITSRWVEQVAAQRDFRVDWRFISLRLINKHKDYTTDFPPEYEFGHTAGLRMLRVAAAGPRRVGPRAAGWARCGVRSQLLGSSPGLRHEHTTEHDGSRDRSAGSCRPATSIRGRPRRRLVGSTARCRIGGRAVAHRARRRHADPHVPAARRVVLLRTR